MGNRKNQRCHYNNHRRVFRKKHVYKSQPRSRRSPRKEPSLQAAGSRIINLDKLQCYIERLTSHASQCGGTVKLIRRAEEWACFDSKQYLHTVW